MLFRQAAGDLKVSPAFHGADGQRHMQGPTIVFPLNNVPTGKFTVTVECLQQPELNAVYTYFCREA